MNVIERKGEEKREELVSELFKSNGISACLLENSCGSLITKFISPKFLLVVLDIFSFVYFIELYTLLFYVKMFIKSIYRISTIRISKLSFLSTYLFNIRCSKISKMQNTISKIQNFKHFQNNKLIKSFAVRSMERVFLSRRCRTTNIDIYSISSPTFPKSEISNISRT